MGRAVKMTMRANTQQTMRAIATLKDRAPIAIMRALNRSIASGKTVMVRLVAQDLGLKQADVRDRIGVMQASPTHLVAALTASPKRIPLIDFRARGPEPSRGRGRGVTARMPGGAGRYPHAFIASMKSGHRGVFQRVGDSRRLPIRELYGPSIAFVFLKHVEIGKARAVEVFAKNLAHEFKFATMQQTAAVAVGA